MVLKDCKLCNDYWNSTGNDIFLYGYLGRDQHIPEAHMDMGQQAHTQGPAPAASSPPKTVDLQTQLTNAYARIEDLMEQIDDANARVNDLQYRLNSPATLSRAELNQLRMGYIG